MPIELVALSLLPGGWCREIAERLRRGDDAGRILNELAAVGSARANRPFTRPRSVSALCEGAAAAIDRGRSTGTVPVLLGTAAYPALLSTIIDPPPVLWVKGSGDCLHTAAVAIVGSRAGSPYAVAVAERLAADLAERGITVVSGMARGVDSAAHRGALSVDARTVAVLGCGADVVYPPEHTALAREIAKGGALVSELPPGTPPRARFFPRRNRIISGLVQGVVIVEAGERSGSLITARCALEQGRDVLAVPGSVLTGRNKGGHALIRDGARIVESADDVLEELGIGGTLGMRGSGARRPPEAEADARDSVLACVPQGEPVDLDTLAAQTGLGVGRLLTRLLDLELKGWIRREGGGRFVRI